MAKKKESTTKQTRTMRQALTPEAEENQCIHLAMQRAKEQLLDGTASSQVIVHFLKLGSSKEYFGASARIDQCENRSNPFDQTAGRFIRRSTGSPCRIYGRVPKRRVLR